MRDAIAVLLAGLGMALVIFSLWMFWQNRNRPDRHATDTNPDNVVAASTRLIELKIATPNVEVIFAVLGLAAIVASLVLWRTDTSPAATTAGPDAGTTLTTSSRNPKAPWRGDRFDGPELDPQRWNANIGEHSDAKIVVDHGLHLRLEGSPGAAPTEVGILSTCVLKGDFDIRVHYRLVKVDVSARVRVGLFAATSSMQRYSDGPADNQHYMLRTGTGNTAMTAPTTDIAGILRITRQGDMVSGYYGANGDQLLHQYDRAANEYIAGPASITLKAWSDDRSLFIDNDQQVEFTDFTITLGACQ